MDADGTNFGSSEAGKMGGKARAENLTAAQRSQIARAAADARWDRKGVPSATHDGEIELADGIKIACAVLEDGTRVVSQRGLAAVLGATTKPSSTRGDGGGRMPILMRASNLKPFISSDLAAGAEPVEYVPLHGGRTAQGIRAETIPGLLKVWVDAEDAGAIRPQQKHLAVKAKILLHALAGVAVIALVDEATGYQDDRARNALAKILEAFVAKELQRWVSTFRLDYYEGLFRLWEISYDPAKPTMKRPQFFGTLTNNIVYDRLAPGVRQELCKRNPINVNGQRSAKHFQHLTPDVGHPKLKEHLAAVTALMRASKSKAGFMKMLDAALPKYKDAPLYNQPDDAQPSTDS